MHGGNLMGGPGVSGANPYMHPQQQPAPHVLFGSSQQHQAGHQVSDAGGQSIKQEPEGNNNMDDILNMFLKDD